MVLARQNKTPLSNFGSRENISNSQPGSIREAGIHRDNDSLGEMVFEGIFYLSIYLFINLLSYVYIGVIGSS
jgi:hypothetical protein